ncbi:MAG: hypothetical protein ABIO19_10420 [Burkholderiaceae bacterium]
MGIILGHAGQKACRNKQESAAKLPEPFLHHCLLIDNPVTQIATLEKHRHKLNNVLIMHKLNALSYQ